MAPNRNQPLDPIDFQTTPAAPRPGRPPYRMVHGFAMTTVVDADGRPLYLAAPDLAARIVVTVNFRNGLGRRGA